MATQTSPTAALHPHHAGPGGRPQQNGHVAMQQAQGQPGPSTFIKQGNEAIWLQMGMLARRREDEDAF